MPFDVGKVKFGRRPDKPDKRDLQVPRFAHMGIGAPLPSSVDVFAGLSLPVYDQNRWGSCTANAGVVYRRFLCQRFAKYSAADQDLSRMALYYWERLANGDPNQDDGAEMRDIFTVLTSKGVPPESDDPYDGASLFQSPSAAAVTAAEAYKLGAYHRVLDVEGAKSCLASGYPVALGFTVYESFMNIDASGVMPMPAAGDSVAGGHAVVIRGYDDSREMFKVQNSWGSDWGAGGCFWMPYAFIENVTVSEPDMWIGHLSKPWK